MRFIYITSYFIIYKGFNWYLNLTDKKERKNKKNKNYSKNKKKTKKEKTL